MGGERTVWLGRQFTLFRTFIISNILPSVYSHWVDSDATSGSCLCGSFQFEIRGQLGDVWLCHCDLCRKANGSAYSANSKVAVDQFKIISQTSPITKYESSPGAWKHFCSTCGSPAYSLVDWDPDHVRIRLGLLQRDAKARVIGHVWAGSKAEWDQISDQLPKLETGTKPG